MVRLGVAKDAREAGKMVRKQDVREAPASTRVLKEKEPIPLGVRDAYIRELNKNKEAREYAQKKLGWNPETMARFAIGWATSSRRYTIPIHDDAGDLRNFRMYDPQAKGVDKMISWRSGYGSPARLFPINLLEGSTDVLVCEGEKDTILMNQMLERYGPDGWIAITGTGGASTWRDTWAERFEGKNIYIIYDRDESGELNSLMVAAKLVHSALSVRVITLDLTEPKGADVTNYFVDSGKGWDDLRSLIERTELFTPQTVVKRQERSPDETVYEPHLSEASEARYAHRKIRMRATVAGKDLSPFVLPREVAYTCNTNYGEACQRCSMYNRNGLIEHTFERDDPSLIEMLRVGKNDLSSFMRRKLGIVIKCPLVTETVDSEQNVEEVTLVPALEFADTDKEYVSRTAYVSTHGVQANKEYVVRGTTLPHPRTQHAVHFLPEIEPAQSSIDDFGMDDKKRDALRIFQTTNGQSVAEKMQEIAKDLSLNVTRIYGREDLVTAVDLIYHTVLAFRLQEKKVEKAWGDLLVIGDTRTGKTETVQSLIWHYKAGEMSMGENTSFAGLVGGLKQDAAKRWSITWGRIPLNDRRLLVIDEMSGLPVDVIGSMSGIRSNGVAEMVKIETQRTAARTRLIWISNPRDTKSMADYGHGVEAVRALVGRPEDVARFDFVISSATNEVPIEEINAFQHEETPHVYTSDLCRELVLWAWSRRIDDVVVDEAATRKVLELAVEQSKRYASNGGIPLVEGGNHRIKLAKLAVATACRLFSTDAGGEKVVVTPEHVEFAASYLDRVYQKASLDYAGWSETKLSGAQIPQKSLDEAATWVKKHTDWSQLWLTKDELKLEDFKTQFDLDTKEARQDIFVPLSKLRMIDKGRHSAYVKSPAFIQVLKRELRGVVIPAAPEDGADDDDASSPDADIPF